MNVDQNIWSALMEFRQSETPCTSDDWLVFYRDLTFGLSQRPENGAEVQALLGCKEIDIVGMNRQELLDGRLYLYCLDGLGEDTRGTLQLYWPLVHTSKCTDGLYPFVITHMAQSLDGKICTAAGNSKWIGNDENLKHAHRIRACVDGVLVGGNTIASDLPKLNVRHVNGPDPVRLFLTNTFEEFDLLPKVDLSRTFLLCNEDIGKLDCTHSSIEKTISYNGDAENGHLKDLLRQLKVNGIHSILIEGGSTTVSSFWQSGCVDWVQIHIAPIILGGGKSFVQLSGIDEVSDGSELANVFYTQMGQAMMITGECSHSNWSRPISKLKHESESPLA